MNEYLSHPTCKHSVQALPSTGEGTNHTVDTLKEQTDRWILWQPGEHLPPPREAVAAHYCWRLQEGAQWGYIFWSFHKVQEIQIFIWIPWFVNSDWIFPTNTAQTLTRISVIYLLDLVYNLEFYGFEIKWWAQLGVGLEEEPSLSNGQYTHEKRLNITNHQANANQTHNQLSPYTCQNGYCQKYKK